MNETIKTIFARHTSRGFKPDHIPAEQLNVILTCGLHAPSAMNSQNWHFCAVNDDGIMKRLVELTGKALPEPAKERMKARYGGNDNFSIFYGAPTVVIVSGDAGDDYAPVNCGFAAQNLLVAAESLGIGSCVVGLAAYFFNSPEYTDIKKELGIPDGCKSLFAVCLGYEASDFASPDRLPDRVTVI